MIEIFKHAITSKKYFRAAKIYFAQAYRFQTQFNEILIQHNCDKEVRAILRNLPENGQHTQQF